jgi:hypothetical protein
MHRNAIRIDGSSGRSDRACSTRPDRGRTDADPGPQRWRNAPWSQVAVACTAAMIVASSSGSEPAYG